MNKKQTAVEYLAASIKVNGTVSASDYIKALKMERKQIKDSYNHGSLSLLETGHGDTFEQYYTQTYCNPCTPQS